MAGESVAHGDICINLAAELRTQLRGGPCRVLSKDLKMRSVPAPKTSYSRKGLFSYPDLVVICGGPQFQDEHRDVLLNPAVIIEVLSPSSEAFDRGEKWLRYQTWLPNLAHYVLVSQTRPEVEHFERQRDGRWLYSLRKGVESILRLESIDFSLALSEIYDRVTFATEEN